MRLHTCFALLSVAAVGAASFAAAVGCSSGSSESAQDRFMDQLCQTFEPCCGAAGLPFDEQACKNWSYWQGPAFDADAGSACLAAMQQAQADGSLCGALPAVCAQVFGPNWGTVPPGGTCSNYTDCDPGDGGELPICFGAIQWLDGGVTPGTCTQMSRGKPGDGPCFVQQSGGVTSASWPASAPTHGVVCDEADSVWCDFDAGTCEPFKDAGEACDPVANAPECGWSATCSETITPECVPLLAAGAACDPVNPTCAANLYCDPTASICMAMHPLGAPCTAEIQCPGQCSQAGRCASEAQLTFCSSP